MNCPICNTVLPRVVGPAPTRCLDCGSLLSLPSETPISAPPAQFRHCYATPFGKWIAQVQPKGGWGAAYEFAAHSLPHEKLRPLVSNLCESYGHADSLHLAKFVSFDEDQRRVQFKFGRGHESSPLSAAKLPIAANDVASIVEGLIPALERLHSAQLAAFDLHPAVIFVDEKLRPLSLLPSLWLASQARHGAHDIEQMPCVAPELTQSDRYPDATRADIFAIGALAWLLLTGKPRKPNPQTLPSLHSAALGNWDAFIDGCCRSNPARRFASLDDVRHALNDVRSRPRPLIETMPEEKGEAQFQYATNKAPKFRRINRRMLFTSLAAVTAVGSGAYFFTNHSWSLLGGVTSYQRGFADTIIRYADRSYDQASWHVLKEAEAVGEVTRIVNSGDYSLLHRVTGWDDDNFVIARHFGKIIQCRNGHWSLLARIEDANDPVPRMLDAENVLVAGDDTDKHLFHASARGVVDLGEICLSGNRSQLEITPIAPDLIYASSSDHGILKVANGKGTQLSFETKEAFVHTADNVPLKEYPASLIRYTATWQAGEAYGIADQPYWLDNSKRKVVKFKNGIWYVIDDLPEKDIRLQDAWFSGTNETPFVVLVGDDGYVLVSNFGAGKLDQSIRAAQEITSLKLIAVWGVDSNKYWMMDENGTIWERNGNESRVVVRGLRKDKVTFIDAWVSPTGTVVGITEKQVYRLT